MNVPTILQLFDNISNKCGITINYMIVTWNSEFQVTPRHVAPERPRVDPTYRELKQCVGDTANYAIIHRLENALDVETSGHRQIYPALAA